MNLTDDEPTDDKSGGGESEARTDFVSFEDLLKETAKAKPIAVDVDETRQAQARQIIRERETIRQGNERYYQLRDKWSWFIFIFISFMLIFQLLLTMAIGFGWADFSEYKAYLHLIVGENFAQIVGMGYIVAKYLFPQGPKKS